MRFTLNKLFVAVALLALACSGMFYRTGLWADSIFTLTVVLLIGVLFWAMGRSGRQRAAGLAGGIVGLGYLFVLTSALFAVIRESLLTNYPLAWTARAMRVDGPTYMTPSYGPAVYTAAPVIIPDADVSATPSGITPAAAPAPIYDPSLVPTTMPPPTAVPVPYFPQYTIKMLITYGLSFGNEGMPISHFFLIGHCVWSWLIALLGAWLAGRMYDRRERAARAA